MGDFLEKENKTKTFIFYLHNAMTPESSNQIFCERGKILVKHQATSIDTLQDFLNVSFDHHFVSQKSLRCSGCGLCAHISELNDGKQR